VPERLKKGVKPGTNLSRSFPLLAHCKSLPFLATEMAFEKGSSADGSDQVHKTGNPAYLIDERRRAALAEIDNAKFS
jgi:hypothetical protein